MRMLESGQFNRKALTTQARRSCKIWAMKASSQEKTKIASYLLSHMYYQSSAKHIGFPRLPLRPSLILGQYNHAADCVGREACCARPLNSDGRGTTQRNKNMEEQHAIKEWHMRLCVGHMRKQKR